MIGPRGPVLMVSVNLALFVGLLLGGLRCVSRREGARVAAEGLAACRKLGDQIAVLKRIPTHASLESRGRQDMALAIQRAAQLAHIPDLSIVRVTPLAGRRLGKSAYLEQPTTVELQQVSLEQLVRFLRELSNPEQGLTATSLRLTAPRTPGEDRESETWSVEVILTHLVFSPEYAPAQTPVSPIHRSS